ncbi:hypothetical protein [Actinokineospora xionganensis]|uniref:GDSL-like lipase/acylhydrolase family protein n=1 Tax=Actinokineospora xionganensis TaxID=2684470 RepID=A0ABR7KYV3_9PSEU|nr:hypothetical protein [Actinokineospora xionganensis]MBC6445622.1 hypothetical protein [Actinokineospora xionganensis]
MAKIDEIAPKIAAVIEGVRARAGHDVCQLPWNRWVEPVLPAAPTTPFHPNQSGQRGVADLVLTILGA